MGSTGIYSFSSADENFRSICLYLQEYSALYEENNFKFDNIVQRCILIYFFGHCTTNENILFSLVMHETVTVIEKIF